MQKLRLTAEHLTDADYPSTIERFYTDVAFFEEMLVEAIASENSATMPCLQALMGGILNESLSMRTRPGQVEALEQKFGHLMFHLINNFVEAQR